MEQNKITVVGSENQKPFAMRLFSLVPKYWDMCSEGTKNNFLVIAQTLIVMSVFLGSLLAMSVANLCFGSAIYGLFLFPITLAFYVFIDRMIVMGRSNGAQVAIRICIAVILVALSCIPIDDMLFHKDIEAIYQTELQVVRQKSQVAIDSLNNIRSENVKQNSVILAGLNDSISNSRNVATKELDILIKGTRNGDGPNYKAKRAAFGEEEAQRLNQIADFKAQFSAQDSVVNMRIEKEIQKSQNAENTVSNGLATRVQRLYGFIFSNTASSVVCVLIWIFFLMLEMMVLIVKYKHPTDEYYLYQEQEAETNVSIAKEQNRISSEHFIEIATARSNVDKDVELRKIHNGSKVSEYSDNNFLEINLAKELSSGLNYLNSIIKETLLAHPDLKTELEKSRADVNKRTFVKHEELVK